MTEQLVPIEAKFVRRLDGWRTDARLYRLSEPVKAGWAPFDESEPDDRPLVDYVVVSGVVVDYSGPETYIFAANAEGDVVGPMLEMPGSFRGEINHAAAIEGAGWILVP